MTEIPESDWLKAGFYWIALGVLAIVPPFAGSFLGRLARGLFTLTIAIHLAEGIYVLGFTEREKLDRRRWFWRTIMLGHLAIRRLHALSVTAPPAPRD
jgi:hypothetical protein